MFYVTSACPACGNGVRGFRLCDDGKTVVVGCDDCDSIWLDARQLDLSNVVDANPPDFRIPGTSCSLSGSRWATDSEVERAGWTDLVAGEWKAFDEKGKTVTARRRWNASEHGPLSEASVRALFVPASKYRFNVRHHAPGTTFPGWSRVGTHVVVSGVGRFNGCDVTAGDILETAAGKYTVEALGTEDLVIVSVWEEQPAARPPDA